MSHNNRSTSASISFEIILSPEVIREYFNGLAKVEAAKNGTWKPSVEPPITLKPDVHVEAVKESKLEQDDTKQTSVDDDAEFREQLTQAVSAAVDMQDDTQEEKDVMKRILPSLMDFALSTAKSMHQTISSEKE